MRAILLANATVTSLTGRRCRISLSQAPSALCQPSARPSIDVAPSTSSLRVSLLPALVIRPRRVLPPVEFCRGTKPSQAANCRAVLNRLISTTVATISDAVIGPIPGDRRQTAGGLIGAGMRNDLGFEGLDPFTQIVAVIMQSGDRLFGLFGNVLVRIDKCHQFVELSYAFWNGDAEFGGQATHGVCQHR